MKQVLYMECEVLLANLLAAKKELKDNGVSVEELKGYYEELRKVIIMELGYLELYVPIYDQELETMLFRYWEVFRKFRKKYYIRNHKKFKLYQFNLKYGSSTEIENSEEILNSEIPTALVSVAKAFVS